MCYDYSIIEKLLPSKIRNSRDRPNVSGADKKFCDDRDLDYNGRHKSRLIKGRPMKRISYGNVCQSITFGLTRNLMCKTKGTDPIPCRANRDYPELYKEMLNMMTIIAPNHKFNSITLNHNFKCHPHYDAFNKSPSVIVGLGDYAGGECVVEGCAIDIKHNPLCFNGSKMRHWTNNFCGERWSMVFYMKFS